MRLLTLTRVSSRRSLIAFTCLLCAQILAPRPMIAAQNATRTVWDGVYTERQAADGAEIYRGACASCHGDALGGVEAAPALVGFTFNTTWNGTTLNDLAERIRVSMPSDDPGSLSRRRVAEVLAFMLSAGGFPEGEFVLDPQAAVLGQIRFLSRNP